MRETKQFKDKPVIYGIENFIDGKLYVGKTKCMYRRRQQYIYDFKHDRALKHLNTYLYNAMKKHEFNNFEMIPLEFCELEELKEKELKWILRLRSNEREFGYNLRLDSSTGMITSIETYAKQSENLKIQWEAGIRDSHGEKLKENWNKNPERKALMPEYFKKLKTKYQYIIEYKNELPHIVDYQELKELGFANILATFWREGVNTKYFKGVQITRELINE